MQWHDFPIAGKMCSFAIWHQFYTKEEKIAVVYSERKDDSKQSSKRERTCAFQSPHIALFLVQSSGDSRRVQTRAPPIPIFFFFFFIFFPFLFTCFFWIYCEFIKCAMWPSGILWKPFLKLDMEDCHLDLT